VRAAMTEGLECCSDVSKSAKGCEGQLFGCTERDTSEVELEGRRWQWL
jgi:hypothetical protein